MHNFSFFKFKNRVRDKDFDTTLGILKDLESTKNDVLKPLYDYRIGSLSEAAEIALDITKEYQSGKM